MVFFEKSQPAPACLAIEKSKKSDKYNCGDVLDRLKEDFKNKCYICEYKEPTSINIEHFKPHKGDRNLMFDWGNLFLACAHCNNIKSDKYENILNCTDISHKIEAKFKYSLALFPFEDVVIEALDNAPETISTKNLLLAVYNGTTQMKMLEADNLKNKLFDELVIFSGLLRDYFKDVYDNDAKQYFFRGIKAHLSRKSSFTAFKRSIILNNPKLKQEFEKYFD